MSRCLPYIGVPGFVRLRHEARRMLVFVTHTSGHEIPMQEGLQTRTGLHPAWFFVWANRLPHVIRDGLELTCKLQARGFQEPSRCSLFSLHIRGMAWLCFK